MCVTGAPAVRRAAIPVLGCPLSRDTRSVPGYRHPGVPALSGDTPSIPGCPLCRDTRSISGYPSFPGYPPSRGTLYPGVFPISGYPLFPEVPPLSLGTRSIPGYPLWARARSFPFETIPD